jgi:hypothetical protein
MGKRVEARVYEIVEKEKDKTSERAKEMMKKAADKIVDELIDHYIPGGDNHAAKEVAHSVIKHDPWWKAAIVATLTPSVTGESQFTDPLQIINNPPVVPANPSNENALTTQHVESQPVVPASTANSNAVPATAARADSYTGGMVEKTY